MKIRLSFHAVCALVLCLSSFAQSRRSLTPDDYYRLQEVREPRCSPDGKWIAYTVTSSDRESDKLTTSLWMINWEGTQDIQLTYGPESAGSPRWSPDGRYLAFTSSRKSADKSSDDDSKSQIWLLDRRGGEAHQLTDVKNDIDGYEWSPDGKHLVLELENIDEAEVDKVEWKKSKVHRPIVIDSYHFKEDVDGYFKPASETHLYLYDIQSKSLQPLTTANLLGGKFSDSDAAWSPDGSRIAFVRRPQLEPNQNPPNSIMLIEPRFGATPQTLLSGDALNHLLWSPDSRNIAFLQGVGGDPKFDAYNQHRVAVISAAGGTAHFLSDKVDRAMSAPVFSADGSSVTALIEENRLQYPATVPIAGGSPHRDIDGTVVVLDLSAAAGHVAATSASDSSPAEIYAVEDGRLRKLTSHNDALMAEVHLGAVEDVDFRSKDGTDVHGLVVKPPAYEAGKKYPAILWIHGGPTMQDDHALQFDLYPLQFERQLFATHGYVVLSVNYRGSTGRGIAYERSIFADWGNKEVADLLAGVDYITKKGLADPDHLGIGGWSYGGILTDYTIASDPRFKAAISGAGSANQISMYGSDQYVRQYNSEIGPPWRAQDLWIKISYPFFHADRIRTPTMFVGGEKDFNVPIIGGEQMYQSLRTLGVPTQLLIYPDQFHLFTRPSYIHDRMQRYLAWWDKYLK